MQALFLIFYQKLNSRFPTPAIQSGQRRILHVILTLLNQEVFLKYVFVGLEYLGLKTQNDP
jgi:hypothetical protein